MIKPKLLVAVLAVILFFTKAHAQTDTSYYDLGRIHLKKDFTQSVTVKGEDLEKMPFTNLAEALNVWFYGSYSNSGTLIYVIDGNLVNDVNAYSIYDIEEATLIQNAVTNISGAAGPEQLIIIKTRRAKAKGFGITANAQANVTSLYTNNNFDSYTNSYTSGLKSTTTVYQQYYISAHETTDNVNFGISADYLRDVLPVITQQGTVYNTAQTLNRLKFNTYLNVKMGNSVLDVTASYDPQKIKYTLDEVTEQDLINESMPSHIFNGTLSLSTHFAPGFTNVLHGDYNYYRENEAGNEIETFQNGTNEDIFKSNTYDHNIVIYDNLSYKLKFGDWTFEPAVNLNFRTFRDSSYSSGVSYSDGIVEGTSYGYGADNTHLFLLTPSLSFYYKTYFNIQAGFLDDLSTIGLYYYDQSKPQTVLPYVNLSLDVLHLLNANSPVTLKVYGSFSVNDLFTDNYSTLQGFANPSVQIPVIGEVPSTIPYYGTNIYTTSASYLNQGISKSYKTFSGGLSISPDKSGLSLSYFFEKTSYLSPVDIFVPYGANGDEQISTYTSTNLILNRLSLNYKLATNAFNWQTGINATMIKQTFTGEEISFGTPTLGGGEWTGGWVNRLSYHSFFAGVDVLYQMGEKVYTETGSGTVASKVNSFSLQNLYAGYRLKIKGLKDPEIFANARNIFQNRKEDITDGRKYYGLGLNFSL